jgi:putative ABC transport system substrate-binding protein
MKQIYQILCMILFCCAAQASEMKKVYISKVTEHPALNETERGIVDYLLAHHDNNKQKLDIRVTSAQGSAILASQIASKFSSTNPDVVVGIGTIAAQSLAKYAIKGQTKLVFSSVTDPIGAKLAISAEKLQDNITGVSNFVSLEPQIALFKEVLPNLKLLGVIYNPSESNSHSINAKLQEICPQYGITIVKVGATKTSEVPQAALSILDKVDAFFVSNDNTALGALQTIVKIANKQHKPVFVSDVDAVHQGALLALGPNQYDIGKQTGQIILSVLNGQAPSQIQIQYPLQTELVINLKAANTIALTLPRQVLQRANKAIR